MDSMGIIYIILSVAVVIACIAMIVTILMQKKRTAGLSGSMAGMGTDKTYWDKNKGRSLEGKLEKYTKILGAAYMILVLALNVIR